MIGTLETIIILVIGGYCAYRVHRYKRQTTRNLKRGADFFAGLAVGYLFGHLSNRRQSELPYEFRAHGSDDT